MKEVIGIIESPPKGWFNRTIVPKLLANVPALPETSL
jgi:hypothetical protein